MLAQSGCREAEPPTELSRLCTGLAQCSGKDHSLIHSEKQLRYQSAPRMGSASTSTPPAPTDPTSRHRAELEGLHAIP